MNTWKAILAALVIFSAGLVTGSVLSRVKKPVIAPGAPVAAVPGTPTRPNGARPAQSLPLEHLRKMELMMRVQKELNLTTEQRANIERVITAGQEHVRDLWNQVAPDIHDELQAVKEKVFAELTAEQKQRFEDLLKRPPQHKPASTNAPPKAVSP